MFAAQPHDDPVAGIDFHQPPGNPVGMHGIDGVRRGCLIAADDSVSNRISKPGTFRAPHGDALVNDSIHDLHDTFVPRYHCAFQQNGGQSPDAVVT